MKFKRALLTAALVVCMAFSTCTSVSAQEYDSTFPEYCPITGGAWMEVVTSQGTICLVLPANYQEDTFGFAGFTGYNVANITTSTVSGNAYKNGTFSYYGNPSMVQCRFARMGTLEVYEPYSNNYGGTSYQWTSLPITEVKATNIGFMDESGERYNNAYLYSTTEKLLILVFVSVCLVTIGFVLWRCWRA